jgi:hypothetical protein
VVANSGSAIAVSTARLTQSDIDLLKIGGTDAVLREDDSETVLGTAASPRLADGGGLLTSAFAQMYVLPQYDDVHNVHRTIAFDRHVDFSDLIGDPPYDNARDLPSTDNFWATLVVSCYEGRTSEDADPDEGPMVEMAGYGETPLSNFASNLTLIYYETLRDMHDSFTDEAHTVVHEIAHAGCDDSGDRHSKTGIMQVAAPRQESDFDAETIVKIRRKKYW